MTCCCGEIRQQKAFKLAFAIIAPAVLCLTAFLVVLTYTLRATHNDAYGRSFVDHHSPRCCFTDDCLGAAREGFFARTGSYLGKHAFVTSLRTPEYLVLLKDLKCFLERDKPWHPTGGAGC